MNVPEDLQPADTVDARGLFYVPGDGAEELHHQEDADRHRHARQDHA